MDTRIELLLFTTGGTAGQYGLGSVAFDFVQLYASAFSVAFVPSERVPLGVRSGACSATRMRPSSRSLRRAARDLRMLFFPHCGKRRSGDTSGSFAVSERDKCDQ